MATINIESQVGTPTTPDPGFVKIYSSGTTIKYMTSDGTVRTVALGITTEEVQDLLQNSFHNTSSIEWIYDDANDRFEATISASVLDTINNHIANTSNPHAVTKTQVGLSNVPNIDATNRANHTGTQLASTISDFETAIANYLDEHEYEETTPYSHTSNSFDWMFNESFTIAHTKKYICTISYVWAVDNNTTNFEAQLDINNGAQVINLTEQEAKDSGGNIDGFGTDQSVVHSYTFPLNLTAGNNTFRLDFRSESNGVRSGMRRASIYLRRSGL